MLHLLNAKTKRQNTNTSCRLFFACFALGGSSNIDDLICEFAQSEKTPCKFRAYLGRLSASHNVTSTNVLFRRPGTAPTVWGVVFSMYAVLTYVHNKNHTMRLCTYVSTAKRDKTPKGEGWSPTFQIRINPELRQQLNEAAERAGMSLGNWIKELARAELRKQGIDPKG